MPELCRPTSYPFELSILVASLKFWVALALLIPFVSVAAAWGLLALFIAVFPANINLAINNIPSRAFSSSIPLLGRLPFQAVLIAWAWWYTRRSQEQPGAKCVAAEVESLANVSGDRDRFSVKEGTPDSLGCLLVEDYWLKRTRLSVRY